jgi:hypothetical protein
VALHLQTLHTGGFAMKQKDRPTTVRGSKLREEIIKSEEKGIDYRNKHQGQDTIKNVKTK